MIKDMGYDKGYGLRLGIWAIIKDMGYGEGYGL